MSSLPPDGALGRELSSGWTTTHELLAALIETVDVGNRILYAVNTPKGTQIPKPIKIHRPHETKEVPKMSPVEDIRTFFGMRYVGKVN